MGICFSARKKPPPPSSPPLPSSVVAEHSTSPSPPPPPATATPATGHNREKPNDPSPPTHTQKPQNCKPEETPSKKPLFLVTPSKMKKPTSLEAPTLPSSSVEEVEVRPTLLDDSTLIAPPRTSSYTKEEVESILIQCGRLSRSSSGNADSNGRRYSGSKRSLDLDSEKRGEDWESSIHQSSSSRPSPRRRAHSRERDGGGRRVSRSPGRRTEQPVASGAPRQQPGKMVSVPPREKSTDDNGSSCDTRRNQWSGGRGSNGPVRSSSPRSRSPGIVRVGANENSSHVHGGSNGVGHQTLSRSSSRKGEQSPYRRNPMAEINGNRLRGEEQKPVGDQSFAKTKNAVTPTPTQGTKTQRREAPNTPSKAAREQLMLCRTEGEEDDGGSQPQPPMDVKPLGITRSRSSRRSSRDLDAILSNPPASSSYASVLLEDIQNYHQQSNGGPQCSLPACVSKACTILEAVADLKNGSFSSSGQMGSKEGSSFIEPKLEQSSLHKFAPVRNKVTAADAEPQESAGSNSFVGQQQWGAGSCDGIASESSSDRCRTPSWSVQQEEEEDGGSRRCDGLQKGGRGNSGRRRELENRGRVRKGISGGGRAYSAPVGGVAAAASSIAGSP